MASKNKPKHEVRLGRIKGTIWENETKTGPRCNVTFTRIYKDGNDWKDSDSFGRAMNGTWRRAMEICSGCLRRTANGFWKERMIKHRDPNTKHQASNTKSVTEAGEFGVWDFFGVWCLDLGASPP